MKNKIIASIFIGIFLLGTISALVTSVPENLNCSKLKIYKNQIIGYKIPKQIPYGNEIFNVYIKNKIFGSLTTTNGSVSNFSCLKNINRTYEIYIKNSSIFEEFASPNKSVLKTFNSAMNDGEIDIKGIGFGKKLKLFFSKLELKILSLFF